MSRSQFAILGSEQNCAIAAYVALETALSPVSPICDTLSAASADGADMHASKPLTIFFSAGEPSGDLHGANLIRQLQARCPGLQAVGYGGPKMAEAGCQLHADLTALAVMWFARVLVNLHKFWGLVSRADRYFRHHRPDAVVLIDYPGFNWWIARRAKVHGIPVFYYTPPQIWAWARWRVKKMRRLVDHVLCSLPFEEAWLRRHGCNATFVGHPFFDEVRRYAVRRAVHRRASRPAGPAGGDPARLADPGSHAQPALVPQGGGDVRRAGAGRAVRRGRVQAAPGRDRPADGRAERAADRNLRGQDARADAAGRLCDVGLRLGLAGTALSHHADGDPLLDQPVGLFRAEVSSAR